MYINMIIIIFIVTFQQFCIFAQGKCESQNCGFARIGNAKNGEKKKLQMSSAVQYDHEMSFSLSLLVPIG